VGNGNLHTRPFVDTNCKNQVELMKHIATQVFKTVITLGGTITGEHGDGLARAKYIQSVYGKEIFSMFKIIKKLFDPTYIMNPGKKIIQQDKINIF
jgi:FAD/FMN-containing dehydrogenase